MTTSSSATVVRSHDNSSSLNPSLTDRVRSLRLPEQQRKRRQSPRFAWTVAGLLGVMCAILVYRDAQRPNAPAAVAETDGVPASSADSSATTAPSGSPGSAKPGTTVPVADSGAVALESKGYLIPAHQILVSPKVSGMITKLFIEEGQLVQKGQVIGELEKVDYEADLQRARATLELARARQALIEAGTRSEEIDQAQAEAEEAERQLRQYRNEYDRVVALRSRDRNLVTDSEFEMHASQYEAGMKKVDRLQSRLLQLRNGNRPEEKDAARAESSQAEAELKKAEWRLSNCTILAPISGTVLKKNAEEGNIVNPVAFNGSYSLCDLADLSDLEVDLSIQERDVSKVYPRQACRIRSDAYPDRIYEGYVDRLMPIADRAKGAVPVRVKVKVAKEEEGVYLKPEMSALVTFLNRRIDDQPSTTSSTTSSSATSSSTTPSKELATPVEAGTN